MLVIVAFFGLTIPFASLTTRRAFPQTFLLASLLAPRFSTPQLSDLAVGILFLSHLSFSCLRMLLSPLQGLSPVEEEEKMKAVDSSLGEVEVQRDGLLPLSSLRCLPTHKAGLEVERVKV